ncbi:hypothetical protein BDW75DRAFT_249802 [Aspergillus navahoensis]
MTSAEPAFITLTPTELSSTKISSHNLQSAIKALHHDGLVILTNAVSTAHLDKLNARMVPEAKALYAQPSTHQNFGPKTGNIQQEPVLQKGYIFQDIVANPFAVQVVECMIGPRPALRFYSANTAFQAKDRQPVHVDVDFDFPMIPWGYAVNITLVDTTPENGATEVWLGSHTGTSRNVLDPRYEHEQVRAELLEERRMMGRGGIQPERLPKGSLVIRDMRLWHAGMPNRTEAPRVMLKIILPESLKGEVEGWQGVDACVEWVGEGYDYLQGRHDHDFTLKP